mmetsp:Transcript_86644/g.242730  ORF Transcript_86644/g.242730 Transcript_86644/m.242730 type:complete len:286 (-) Transcript_86644:72-929(-)
MATATGCCSDCCGFVLLLLLLFFCCWAYNSSLAECLPAGDAAVAMSETNVNEQLPDKLRGVFWMAGNTYPELLMTLESGPYDAAARKVTTVFGSPYSWSWNDDLLGILEYLAVLGSWTAFTAGTLDFEFTTNFSYAKLTLRIYGLDSAVWYFEQVDEEGNTYIRGQFDNGIKMPVYTIRKVIAHDGRTLPAFEEMLYYAEHAVPVRDIPNITFMDSPSPDKPKTAQGIVVGNPKPGSLLFCCFFYSACCVMCLRRSKLCKRHMLKRHRASRLSVEDHQESEAPAE